MLRSVCVRASLAARTIVPARLRRPSRVCVASIEGSTPVQYVPAALQCSVWECKPRVKGQSQGNGFLLAYPVSASHTRTVVSKPPEATILPSNATAYIWLKCPRKTCRHSPVSMSQSCPLISANRGIPGKIWEGIPGKCHHSFR